MTAQLDEVRAELEKKADKDDLEQGIKGVLNVIERVQASLRQEIAEHTRANAEHVILTIRTDIRADIVQFMRSADGECQRRVAGVDDKYADLPARVTALEARRRR